jgi:tetratricopeptide (TPR) repeat protein
LTPEDDLISAMARRSRVLYEALGDDAGMHVCDLALARAARDLDPIRVLEALSGPLDRLVRTGSLTGLDVLCTEAILAARRLGATERLGTLVARIASPELKAHVLLGLWSSAAEHLRQDDPDGAVPSAWAALDLAVRLGDWLGAATSLVYLVDAHDRQGKVEAALLCQKQAAEYVSRAEDSPRAAVLLEDLAARLADLGRHAEADAALDAAIARFQSAGATADAARALVAGGQRRLARGDAKAAIRLLQKAAEVAGDSGSLDAEVTAWEALAEAWRKQGNAQMADGCAARAELLKGE